MTKLVDILNWQGEIVGTHSLKPEIFSLEYNPKMVHETIRWQLNSRRAATQKVKGRSEVSGAHRKIRAQKGHGKARQGDGKAPHFRGGGVAFGINPRSYEFKLNKKFRRLALNSFLSKKAQSDQIIVIDDCFSAEFNKTKFAKSRLEHITKGEPCTIIFNDFSNTQGLHILHNVTLLRPEGINIHSCVKGLILFHIDALRKIEDNLVLKKEQK